MATQGFQGWARRTDAAVSPSQYVTDDFPALTAGPTIEIDRDESSLTVTDRIASTGYDWDALTPWASRTSPPTSTPSPTGPSSAPRGHVDGNAVIGARDRPPDRVAPVRSRRAVPRMVSEDDLDAAANGAADP